MQCLNTGSDNGDETDVHLPLLDEPVGMPARRLDRSGLDRRKSTESFFSKNPHQTITVDHEVLEHDAKVKYVVKVTYNDS
jgi:hypothetical protein